MIIYNVSIRINPNKEQDWLLWMKNKHLADVMASNCFVEYQFCKLLDLPSDQDPTYVVQYKAQNMPMYTKYKNEYAPALQAEGHAMFGNDMLAYRTLMEVL